jgi:hypothetical protein
MKRAEIQNSKDLVSFDLYKKTYVELDESDQNSVDLELETRWENVLLAECLSYDIKQSRKKFYNPNAYSLYLEAIREALSNPEFVDNPRKVLAGSFIVEGETGGISHRNLPSDFSNVKFSLPFVNSAIQKMKA